MQRQKQMHKKSARIRQHEPGVQRESGTDSVIMYDIMRCDDTDASVCEQHL